MTQAEPVSTSEEISLAQRTSRGFAWLLMQTLGSKAFSAVGQIFLAHLLAPHDYGLVALAYTACTIPGMLRQTGVPQVLVQKQSRFPRWANAGFWMELYLGLGAAILMVLAAPIAAVLFHTRDVVGPILVVASSALISPLAAVPGADLTRRLEFRSLALVGLAYNILAMAISVLLAALHFGVYSFVIPLPVCSALRAVAFWRLARPRIRWNPQFRRWWGLAAGSGPLLGASFCAVTIFTAQNLSLGLFHSKEMMGDYFFAWNLASQVVQLLATNLSGVLFPALSTLQNDPQRQLGAFLRAARAMALLAVPICILEIIFARPGVELIYGVKWLPAVPMVQYFAAASVFTLLAGLAQNLLSAQGRFLLQLRWAAIAAVLYIPVGFVVGMKYGAVALVATTLVYGFINTPIGMFLAVRRGGGRARDVAGVLAPPCLLGLAAVIPAVLLLWLLPMKFRTDLVELLVAVLLTPPLYALLVRRFRRADFDELAGHIQSLLRRIFRREPAP